MINPDAAFSTGDIMKENRDRKREIRELQTARSLEAASIGAGGLDVTGGAIVIYDAQGTEIMRLSTEGLTMEGLLSVIGAILVTGGGDITVDDGGSFIALDGSQIHARYADGSDAVRWGSLVDAVTGAPDGHGLLIQNDEAGDTADIFRAKRELSGDMFVVIGSTISGSPVPVREFSAYANRIELNAEGTDGGTPVWNVVLNSQEDIFAIAAGDFVAQTTSGGNAFLSSDNQVAIQSTVNQVFIDHATVGSDDNCVISSTGLIRRVTSARRFKQDIRDLSINPRTVLDLKPRTWRDRGEVERDAETDRWHVGFIAEEVEDAGLGMFVNYDEAGEPNSLQYDRLTVALLETAKAQQAQLDALTAWATSQGFQPPDVSAETTELPKRRAEAQAKPVKSKAD